MYNDAVISRVLGLFLLLSCVIKLHRSIITACAIYESCPSERDRLPEHDRFSIPACICLRGPHPFQVKKVPDTRSCPNMSSAINEATEV